MRPMVSGGVDGATTTPRIGAPQVRLKCFARVRPTWPGELLRPGVYQSIEIEDNRTIRSSRLIFDSVFLPSPPSPLLTLAADSGIRESMGALQEYYLGKLPLMVLGIMGRQHASLRIHQCIVFFPSPFGRSSVQAMPSNVVDCLTD